MTLRYCPSAASRPRPSWRARVIASALLLAALAVGGARTSAAATPDIPAPALGVAWYPEQWPESRWETDLRQMQAAHVRWVRIAEFSWSALEPREGDYRFDWLTRAIRAAERHGIRVVLGTPTATPPAWLTAKYPETLRIERDGRRVEHGSRLQYDWTSPLYRRLSAGIVRRLADRFGHDPDVIGWQVDNEYEEESYGPNVRALFQAWLQRRYVTLDALNARWTTAYWSQTYSDWSQVPIPPQHGANPGLWMAWRLFVTDEWVDYQRAQLDLLRPRIDPRQKITTNSLSEHESYDSYATSRDLDFVGFDDYVGRGHADLVDQGFAFDQFRGFKRQNFWIMETQPGYVNWSSVNNSLDRGEARALAWLAVGHGVDALGYWQWAPALNGQEQYHGTLVGPDGQPVPFYGEAAQVGAEFDRAAAALTGTSAAPAQVAVLNDYPSRWAINGQRHTADYDPLRVTRESYTAWRTTTAAVDVVSDLAPLAGYRVVVAPALNVLTAEAAANLEAYVRAGGHLVLGPRAGVKDADNALQPNRGPGPLAPLLGARVGQFYALDAPTTISGTWGARPVRMWAELLEVRAPDVEVLARFAPSNGWLDGQPAAVTRRIGRGRITYIGADLDADGQRAVAAWAAKASGVAAPAFAPPPGVDVQTRQGAGRRVLILTNWADGPRTAALPTPMRDVLGSGTVSSVTLPRYGVAVLEAPR